MMPVSARRYWPLAAVALALGAAAAAHFLRAPTVEAQMLEACLQMIDDRNGAFPRPGLVETSSALRRDATVEEYLGYDPATRDYAALGEHAETARATTAMLLAAHQQSPRQIIFFSIDHAASRDAARSHRSICSYVAGPDIGPRDAISPASVRLDGSTPLEHSLDEYRRLSRAARP